MLIFTGPRQKKTPYTIKQSFSMKVTQNLEAEPYRQAHLVDPSRLSKNYPVRVTFKCDFSFSPHISVFQSNCHETKQQIIWILTLWKNWVSFLSIKTVPTTIVMTTSGGWNFDSKRWQGFGNKCSTILVNS